MAELMRPLSASFGIHTRSQSKTIVDQLTEIQEDVKKSMRSLDAGIKQHTTKLLKSNQACETACYAKAAEDSKLLGQLKKMKTTELGYDFANMCKLLLTDKNKSCIDYVREINYLGMYYSELGKQMADIEEILKIHNPSVLKKNRHTLRSSGSPGSNGSSGSPAGKGSHKKKGTKKKESVWL